MAPRNVLYIEANTDGTVGGSHTCLLELVRGLDRSRYNPVVLFYQRHALLAEFEAACEVIVYDKPGPFRAPALKRAARNGSPLATLARPLLLGKRAYNLASQVLLPTLSLMRIMKGRNIHLVHLNNAVAQPPEAALAARLLGLPCVAHQRCVSNGLGPMTRRLTQGLGAVACISEHVRAALIESGVDAARCHLIYDGCDAAALRARVKRPAAEVRREFGVENGQPLLCLVGNLKPWKGQRTAVEAAALLRRMFPGLTLLLVGSSSDKPYVASLRNLIAAEELGEAVRLTGFRPDVAELMNAADLVLHTSIEPEPLGLVILEAAALAKPCVATAIGGPAETIEHEVSGLLVPPGDPQALAAAVGRLLGEPRLARAMGEAGRQRLESRFSLRSHLDRVQALYASLAV